jgi:chlorite dismutase
MNAHDKFLQADYTRQDIDHAALQAQIQDEAESRLKDWESVSASGRDAHDFELLQNDIDFIISFAAKAINSNEDSLMEEMTCLGLYVAAKVQRAATKVATYVCTEKS